jgi:hypothetical protein
MVEAYLNQIATAVPEFDVHTKFVESAPSLLSDERYRVLFMRMAGKSQIEHRYSFLKPHPDVIGFDANDFYLRGAFPDTETRMRFFEHHAFTLAKNALDQLDLSSHKDSITHLILTTCTGFYAPGIDLQVVEHYGLSSSVERTIIGFMGCYAGLAGAEPCWPRPLSIFGIPYGFVYRTTTGQQPGLYRLGDQMAVIPSFYGYGMSIALHTAFLAVEGYLHRDADTYHQTARRDLLPLIRRASFLSKIAEYPLAQQAMLLACRMRPELITSIAAHSKITSLRSLP